MAASLATAYVDIEPRTDGFASEAEKQLTGALKKPIEAVNDKVSNGMAGAFEKVGKIVAGIGVAAFFKSSISAASDLGEQVSKAGTVFGTAKGKVEAFADAAVDGIGASKLEAISATTTFGSLLKSVGLTQDAAADMSIDMVQLAGDMASFNNVPVAATLEALQAGLLGETEPLRQFGVNLTAAKIEAEAMRLGLTGVGQEMTDQAKTQATYSLIVAATSDAQGDFARTSEGLAGQQKKLGAEFENAKAKIGEALMPAMLAAVEVGGKLIPVFAEMAGALGQVVGAAAPAVSALADFVGTDIGGMLVTATATAGGTAYAFNEIGDSIGKIKDKSAEAGGAMKLLSSFITPAGVAGAFAAVAIGTLAAVFKHTQDTAAEYRAEQERFNEAMLAAEDPTSVLGKRYEALGVALDKVAKATEKATGATENNNVIQKTLIDNIGGNIAAFGDMGYSIEQVTKLVGGGKKEWNAYIEEMRGKSVVDGRMEQSTYEVVAALEESRDRVEENRKASAKLTEALVNRMVLEHQLTPEIVANAKATSGSKDSTEQWLAVATELAPQLTKWELALKNGGDAAAIATVAQDKLASSAEKVSPEMEKQAKAAADLATKYGLTARQGADLALVQEDLAKTTDAIKDAQDAVTKAYDEARDAQDKWLFSVSGAQIGADEVTTSLRDYGKELADNAAVAGTDADAIVGNTDAHIGNRKARGDALQTLLDYRQKLFDEGATAEDAAAKTLELAGSITSSGGEAILSEGLMSDLVDTVNTIPPEKTTKVTVAEEGLKRLEERLAELEYREYEARVLVTTVWNGMSPAQIAAQISNQGPNASTLASGAFVKAIPGGTLAWVGEGKNDEAVIPLPPGLLEGLTAVADQAKAGQLGQNGGTSIQLNIAVGGAMSEPDAQRTGRIVGETAAQVLSERRAALALRVGG